MRTKKKMDPKLLSKEAYEIKYVTSRHLHATEKVVREVQALVGGSRGKVYAELKRRGYELKKRIRISTKGK